MTSPGQVTCAGVATVIKAKSIISAPKPSLPYSNQVRLAARPVVITTGRFISPGRRGIAGLTRVAPRETSPVPVDARGFFVWHQQLLLIADFAEAPCNPLCSCKPLAR